MLQELNDTNNASNVTQKYYAECLTKFENQHLYGAEFGIAYGGGVEKIGKLWGSRGTVWGFDTFEGHPKFLKTICEYTKKIESETNKDSAATYCMDQWYTSNDYGNYEIYQKMLSENLFKVIYENPYEYLCVLEKI